MPTIYVGDVRDRIKEIPDGFFNLHVSSFPYGSIKKYSDNPNEIGFGMTPQEYYDSLECVLSEMVRTLATGSRMVINIGDEFLKANKKESYRVLSHSSEIISLIRRNHSSTMDYTGTIRWEKVTTSNTSGGGKVMGSFHHPPNSHFFINHEHIITFRKKGKTPKSDYNYESRWTKEERKLWFKDRWSDISPIRQNGHIAQFPLEIPERIMRMYSRIGDKVGDVFIGSGTTAIAGKKLNRDVTGFELGFNVDEGTWQDYVLAKYEKETKEKDLIFK